MALFLALLSAVSGPEWLGFAAGVLGIGFGLLGFAVFLWMLRSKLRARFNRWRLVTFLVQVGLIVVGIVLVQLVSGYQPGTPQNPGTDGPFADGSEGAIGLSGYLFVLGGLVALVQLMWEAASKGLRIGTKT
jgi:hypothetical protein